MRYAIVTLCVFILLAGSSLQSQAQAPAAPLTEKEVISSLKSDTPENVAGLVNQRGVAFELSPEIEKRLRKAKATDAVIEAVRRATPAARAAAAKQAASTAGLNITPEESQALRTIQNELDPERVIQLTADFEKKYPTSAGLTLDYYFAAHAYELKGDIANTIAYAEKSLKLNGDNVATLLLAAYRMPSPQFLRLHADEKEKYLSEAEGYAERALKLLPDPNVLPKQAAESDVQYTKRKDTAASVAHAALGMIHLQRARLGLTGLDKGELEASEKEFTQAVTMTDQPAGEDYFRLGEAYSLDGKVDQAIEAFTKASADPRIKAFADPRIQELKKRQTAPPATPAPKP